MWEGFVVSNQYRCTILIWDAQFRQDNQPVITRWCMLHISTGGFRCEARAMKRTIICCVPLELLLRNGHLSVFSIRGTLDMTKVLCILCIGSVVHIHQTLHEHIRTTPSCRLLFVLRTYITTMLLDYVIQHGIDGAHRQWCTLPYTMGHYHQVLSRLALWQWNICFPSTNGVWLLSSDAKSRSTVPMEYMLPFHQLCVLL